MSTASQSSTQSRETQIVAIQPRLNRLAGELRRQGLEYPEYTRDRYELGAKFLTEHPCAGLAPGLRPEGREHGQLQRGRQSLDRSGSADEAHGQHPRAAHRVHHGTHFLE